ncbi:MAG TPA: hypothetical protein VKA67_14175, partial [Verrucomicrobiae bacterium]|nr:hypothetical protein [Verrucomicrobiae bacterium]
LRKLGSSSSVYGWTSRTPMNFFKNRASTQVKPDLGNRFLATVSNTDWQLLKRGDRFDPTSTEEAVVICVAVWSNPDIGALEAFRAMPPAANRRVGVFSLHDFTFEEIIHFMPEIRPFTQTPVVVKYIEGKLVQMLEGQAARDWMEGKMI